MTTTSVASMKDSTAWDQLVRGLEALHRRITKATATNVSAANLRAEAKELVQLYFRSVRVGLQALGLDSLEPLDRDFQALLAVANRINRRTTYLKILREVRSSLEAVEPAREVAIGASAAREGPVLPISASENRIIRTLNSLVPSAALSYQQAASDLRAQGRLSFRGTAAELRETLREILDHLAPDNAVMRVPGFALEGDQSRPTMRQKVRFILKSRGRAKSAIGPAENAAHLVDEVTASLVRSVYERASLSTHVSPTVAEVRSVKSYVDTILVDILEI